MDQKRGFACFYKQYQRQECGWIEKKKQDKKKIKKKFEPK